MQASIEHLERCDLITISGRIDSRNADQLAKTFDSVMRSGRYKIVFDFGKVDFISSKGWWVLIESQKKCKRNPQGEIILVNIQDRIFKSLELVGISKYFRILDDVSTAVDSF
jgi:anti-anti-sigma factor